MRIFYYCAKGGHELDPPGDYWVCEPHLLRNGCTERNTHCATCGQPLTTGLTYTHRGNCPGTT